MLRKVLGRAVIALALTGLSAPAMAETLKVGVSGGPHAQILEKVAELAAKQDLQIKIVEFHDYQLPNAALAQGDLDANSFQHRPFLENQIKDRGYKLTAIAQTVVFPIGIYSRKIKSLDQLKTGDTLGIPNDPTNGGRVLLLLQQKGLITLRPEAGIKATILDITDNPKKLKFAELDAAQLPRSLDDTTASAINTNYAIEAGFLPHRDALLLEDPNSPYANLIVVRTEDKDKPVFAKLVRIYHSPEIRAFILDKFGASLVPAF